MVVVDTSSIAVQLHRNTFFPGKDGACLKGNKGTDAANEDHPIWNTDRSC